jgi:RNA polymerase primary sigma factor
VISLVDERDSNRVVSVIDQLLNGLDERERMIVSSRFGLESSGKKETFSALGKQLGISKERVRQLAERAVNKLRNSAQELGLEEEQWIA